MSIGRELWKHYLKHSNIKYCFYNNKSCSQNIINAHSIQKSTALSLLEYPVNGNNSIYSLEEWEYDDRAYKITDLKPLGKGRASIFTGFCKYHDNLLFTNIENKPLTHTPEQLFLHTYRAFAHSYHQIIEQKKYYDYILQQVTKAPYDLIIRSYWQHLQRQVFVTKVQLNRFNKYVPILNNLLNTSVFGEINYHVRQFNGFIPIASAQILVPVFTYRNYPLKRHEDFSCIVLNVIPTSNSNTILISHFKEDVKGKILFDELKTLNDKEFATAISSLIIYSGMNTFFSPLIWNQFSKDLKIQLINEINFCTNYGEYIKEFFLSKINFFDYTANYNMAI